MVKKTGTKGPRKPRKIVSYATGQTKFAPGRLYRTMKKRNYATRVSKSSMYFLAGVLDTLVEEMILGMNEKDRVAKMTKTERERKRFTPRDFMRLTAIGDDFKSIFALGNFIIPSGGTLENVHPQLLPKKPKPRPKPPAGSSAAKKAATRKRRAARKK
jgi:hypothetical protein